MRQSNGCVSVRNDEINPEKGIKLPTNHIVLRWPIYTEPRAKRCRLGTTRG